MLQNNIVTPKIIDSKEVQENPIAHLVKRIHSQKSSYENTFKGKQYLDDSFATSVEYVESVEIPSESDIAGDFETYLEMSKKLKSILCSFNRAREKHSRKTEFLKEISQNTISESTQTDPTPNPKKEIQLAFDAQKQTIQKLENEIKTLQKTIVADGICLTDNESETVETTVTYESFGDEPSIQCNDLSTQTDFTPRIALTVYQRLHSIKQLSRTNNEHLQTLQQKVKVCNASLGGSINGYKKKIPERYGTFENLALAKLSFIKMKNKNEMDKLEHLSDFQGTLLSRIEILELVKNDKQASAALYFCDSSVSDQANKRNCSSQTEISTLRLSLSLEEIQLNDTPENQIAKLHGEYLQLISDHSAHLSHAKRLRTYVDDLSEGKEIAVLESDLSDELKTLLRKYHSGIEVKSFGNKQEITTKDSKVSSSNKAVDDIQLIQYEIFAQLERKVKSTLNFEIDAAIKKSTESFKNLQFVCNRPEETSRIDKLVKELSDKNNLISEQSKKISSFDVKNAEAERKLRYETSDKNLANMKLKESHKLLKEKESEISKLNTKVSNQNKTNSQQQQAMNLKCKEIEKLKTELKKISSQQT